MNITQNGHAGRLLIVDEDDLTLRFLADNLTADNYATSTAATAGAARILLERDPVDLLLVDVNGNTLRLLDSIRHGEIKGSSPDLPVIVLAGYGDELHRTRLLEHGADDVQPKPFSYPSCAPGSPRCCAAAQTHADPPGCCAPDRSRSTLISAESRSTTRPCH